MDITNPSFFYYRSPPVGFRRNSCVRCKHLAERGGFEPPVPFWSTHAFQACALNHSAISPASNLLCREAKQGATFFGNRTQWSGFPDGTLPRKWLLDLRLQKALCSRGAGFSLKKWPLSRGL